MVAAQLAHGARQEVWGSLFQGKKIAALARVFFLQVVFGALNCAMEGLDKTRQAKENYLTSTSNNFFIFNKGGQPVSQGHEALRPGRAGKTKSPVLR